MPLSKITGNSFNASANTDIDNGLLFINPTTNTVGVGTTNPANRLHVFTGASGRTSFDSRFKTIIENNGEAYLALSTPNTSYSGIRFLVPNGESSGNAAIDFYNSQNYLLLSSSTGSIRINTNSSERAMFSSAGNFGVGTDTPNEKLTVSGRRGLTKPANASDGRCIEFFTAISGSTTAANLFDATCRTGNEAFYYEIIVTGTDWSNNSAARVIKRGFHNPNASYTEHAVIENAGPHSSTIVYEYTKSTNTFTGRLRLTSGDPVTLKVYVKLVGCISSYAVYGTE